MAKRQVSSNGTPPNGGTKELAPNKTRTSKLMILKQ